jgi:glycosyltransferase involved in cell wall biosynthesis
MKVLHVSTPVTWRGGEQQAAYLALALHSEGVEEAVLTPKGSALFSRLESSGVDLHTFSSRGLAGIGLALRIAALCRQEGFDLIHVHDSHAHSAAVMAAVIAGCSVPVIVSRRVDFAVSPSLFSRFKYNHPSVRKIICVSHMIREITLPSIRHREKLCVVHSGIDHERYRSVQRDPSFRAELGLPADAILVGNLSALADHKDYPTFLQTARRVLQQKPDVHFIIAGSGPEEDAIRKQIASLGLQANIHLIGFQKDVARVMKSLDVFLITSSTEGLGTIVLEAFSAGVPVVATAAGGIPELVQHDHTGLSAPVRDDSMLADEVLLLLNNTQLRERLVRQALEKAEHFSFRATAAKTLQVYREVLSADR